MSYPVEMITWTDSASRTGWVYVEDVPNEVDTEPCVSIAHVICESEEFVYCAATVSGENCLGPFSIPQGAILDREVIFEDDDDVDEDDE